jgi:hypothetical protein
MRQQQWLLAVCLGGVDRLGAIHVCLRCGHYMHRVSLRWGLQLAALACDVGRKPHHDLVSDFLLLQAWPVLWVIGCAVGAIAGCWLSCRRALSHHAHLPDSLRPSCGRLCTGRGLQQWGHARVCQRCGYS